MALLRKFIRIEFDETILKFRRFNNSENHKEFNISRIRNSDIHNSKFDIGVYFIFGTANLRDYNIRTTEHLG